MKYASIIVFCVGLYLIVIGIGFWKATQLHQADMSIRSEMELMQESHDQLNEMHNALARAFIGYVKDPNNKDFLPKEKP